MPTPTTIMTTELNYRCYILKFNMFLGNYISKLYLRAKHEKRQPTSEVRKLFQFIQFSFCFLYFILPVRALLLNMSPCWCARICLLFSLMRQILVLVKASKRKMTYICGMSILTYASLYPLQKKTSGKGNICDPMTYIT